MGFRATLAPPNTLTPEGALALAVIVLVIVLLFAMVIDDGPRPHYVYTPPVRVYERPVYWGGRAYPRPAVVLQTARGGTRTRGPVVVEGERHRVKVRGGTSRTR